MFKIVTRGWGYEIQIENNKDYCLKHLHVLPTKWCSVHYHRKKIETFYVISGQLYLEYSEDLRIKTIQNLQLFWDNIAEKKVMILKKGDYLTINRWTPHRFTSNTNEPCDFIEGSTHHEDSDSYRIIKGD